MKLLRITHLPPDLRRLAGEAANDGHRNVATLVDEFATGANRFDNPGEALFAAYEDGSIIGVGGLNVDPYERVDTVGRVRRLFVLPAMRRRGVASALMQEIETAAQGRFRKLQLYTTSSAAAAFYSSLGYSTVNGRTKVSHEKHLAG